MEGIIYTYTTDTRTVEDKQELYPGAVVSSIDCDITVSMTSHPLPLPALATTIHKGVIHMYITLLSTRPVKCML
jgi:hypothetical protein